MSASLRLIIATVWCLTGGWSLVHTAALAEQGDDTVHIVIQQRQFKPAQVVLPHGRTIRLVFKNLDSELHTFAPSGLFVGEHVTVSGNGAPDFGPGGLKRVIIPPDGLAEIRFTPRRPGRYPYICDMPGHQMQAAIIVE